MLSPLAPVRRALASVIVASVAFSGAFSVAFAGRAWAQLPPGPFKPVPPAAAAPVPAATGSGRITGQVVDRATGRPLSSVRISIIGIIGSVETDLDGRYRTGAVPAGMRSVRASLIGYRPAQLDSVRVENGKAVVANVALTTAPVELQELVVQADVAVSKASDAGMLAMQQAAASASDGISAETMKKSPDSDAGDAVTRVTGVSVVGGKFVVVRGLDERYNTTQLNGAELASPEPTKKIVPLDVFPASLLESIVTTKAATPDRPGDFAGAAVEIRTKEFPENFVAQFNVSQEYNSLATFKGIGVAGHTGLSNFFGFDDGLRAMPASPPANEQVATTPEDQLRVERFGEALRNVWTPRARWTAPNVGFGANIGGQFGAGVPVGYVMSFTYSGKTVATPDRLFRFVQDTLRSAQSVQKQYLFTENKTVVDWGGIANLTAKLGGSNKIALKNFFSQNAEEAYIRNRGIDLEYPGTDIRSYQIRYVERSLLQSQLSGEHLLGFLGNGRLEWRGTYSWARRNEPINRGLRYNSTNGSAFAVSDKNYEWFRKLTDQTKVAQLDFTLPLSVRESGDAAIKIGGLYRDRHRDFAALMFDVRAGSGATPEMQELPPEQFFAPENIGSGVTFVRVAARAAPYQADDDLTALYGMLDFPILPWVRAVGGLRVEDWRLNLLQTDIVVGADTDSLFWRRNRDYLWSSNLTFMLSDVVNLRLGAFRSVARPDPREISPDEYQPVFGECAEVGDSSVQRSAIINGDAKFEFYPRVGELISISGFYKQIDLPIVEVLDVPSAGTCRIRKANAKSGRVAGAEFEVRKALTFLPGPLGNLSAGVNVTVVSSRATLDRRALGLDAPAPSVTLQGQSDFLVNASLGYDAVDSRFSASVLYNYFGDRVARYGRVRQNQTSGDFERAADAVEQGRGTLDAKVQKGFGRWSLSLAGKNLTNPTVLLFQGSDAAREIVSSYKTGSSVSLSVGYDF